MKFFESKYTLCVTLGLVCFQMYLTKSSDVDYKALSLRTIAQQADRPNIRCSSGNIDSIDTIIERVENDDKNCFLHFNTDTNELSILGVRDTGEKDRDGNSILEFRNGVIALTDSQIESRRSEDQEEYRALINNAFKDDSNVLSAIPDPRNPEATSVATEERPTAPTPEPEAINDTEVPSEEEIVATTDEAPAATAEVPEPTALPAPSITRTEFNALIKEYMDAKDEIAEAINDCKLNEDDIDLSAADEIYEELQEGGSFKDEDDLKCEDRTCSNLALADHELIDELRSELEEADDLEELISDNRKDIDSCKSNRLSDEDFLTAYEESGKCEESSSSSNSLVLGSERRTRPRPRFQRAGSSSPAPDEELSTIQVCYYQNEILPGFRDTLANGNQAEFNNAIDGFQELAQSLRESGNNNEAIATIGQAHIFMGNRVRQYEDALWDSIERIEASDLSRDEKDAEINDIKRRAAEGYASDRERVASILASGNATLAEQSLFMGTDGLYDFWGSELALVNNERQPLPNGLSQSTLNALTFSGLSTATDSSISNLHDNTQSNVLDSNDRAVNAALGRSSNPSVRQLEDNDTIVSSEQREGVRTNTPRFNDDTQNGRHLRAEGPPTGGPRVRGGNSNDLGLNSERRFSPNDPAVSHFNPNTNTRRSQGRLNRGGQAIN